MRQRVAFICLWSLIGVLAVLTFANSLPSIRKAVAQSFQHVQGETQQAASVIGTVVITTGSGFQQILASTLTTTPRRSLTVQNNNLSDNCWVFIGALANATTARSALLLPGASYSRFWPYVPSDAISGNCNTTGSTMYVESQ